MEHLSRLSVRSRSGSTRPARRPSRQSQSEPRRPRRRSTRKPASCSTGHKNSPRTARPTRPWRMLKRVVKVYKGTPAASESKAALDRAGKNLPSVQRSAPGRRPDRSNPNRRRARSASGRCQRLARSTTGGAGSGRPRFAGQPRRGGRRHHPRPQPRTGTSVAAIDSSDTPSGVPGQSRCRYPRVRLAVGDRGRS